MKVQKKFLLQGAILLFLGLGFGFGLGSFYASAPVIGCRENDLTPIPDEGFVSPAASEVPAGSVPETPPAPPDKWVCLTFDDGPSKTTPDVLAALNAAGVRATFFVVATGYNEKYLPLLAEAEAAGHQIAFHSASHEYSDIYRSPDAYWQDLALLKERIAPYVHTESIRYLRFPGGSTNTVSRRYGGKGIMSELKAQAAEKGFTSVDWNVCAEDAVGGKPSASTIYRNVVRETGDPVHRSDARFRHHPHHRRSPAGHHPVVSGSGVHILPRRASAANTIAATAAGSSRQSHRSRRSRLGGSPV